jgi:hypothetical protein
MAGIFFQTRILGRTITTSTLAIGALIGSVLGGMAGTARGQWDAEPNGSVLVEGGSLAGHEPYRMNAIPDSSDGYAVSDNSGFGAAGMTSGSCTGCGGAGCNECCPSALFDTCCDSNRQGCWVGRVDAMLLWRNAPPDRPIAESDIPGGSLNADGLDSTPAAGPRFSLLRVNNCTGHAIEATYFRAANFRSERPLSALSTQYQIAPPGIYGNGQFLFNTGNANLGSRIQSFEFNRHHALARNIRFVAGFRWIQWEEEFTLATEGGGFTDFYQTGCFNDLYGGQIGIDANIFASPWVRLDGFVKAGAYYNNAVQSSVYTTNDPANPGTASVAVGESPASGAFAGDVGLTAVFPITQNIDIRLGYYALWLSGIAQPTQQLSGQSLTPGSPAVGSLNVDGGVLVQGTTLGLEGRW